MLMAYLAGSGLASVASGMFTCSAGRRRRSAPSSKDRAAPATSTYRAASSKWQSSSSPELVNRVASVTGLSVNEVRNTLNDTATRVEAVRNNPAQAAEAASRGVANLFDRARSSGALATQAQEVQPKAASTAWLTFAALLLSLAAAVAGSMLGRSRAADAVAAAP
jgi:hypothetical protein